MPEAYLQSSYMIAIADVLMCLPLLEHVAESNASDVQAYHDQAEQSGTPLNAQQLERLQQDLSTVSIELYQDELAAVFELDPEEVAKHFRIAARLGLLSVESEGEWQLTCEPALLAESLRGLQDALKATYKYRRSPSLLESDPIIGLLDPFLKGLGFSREKNFEAREDGDWYLWTDPGNCEYTHPPPPSGTFLRFSKASSVIESDDARRVVIEPTMKMSTLLDLLELEGPPQKYDWVRTVA